LEQYLCYATSCTRMQIHLLGCCASQELLLLNTCKSSTYQKSSPPTSSCRSFGKRRHDLQLSHWTHTLLCLRCLSVLGCSITEGSAWCCRLTSVLGGSANIASAHTHSDSPVHCLYGPRVVTISTSALAVQTAAEARGLGPCDKLRQTPRAQRNLA